MAEEVGGISAKVEIDDSNLPAQLAKLKGTLTSVEEKLHILGQSFGRTGVAAALHGERLARLAQSKAELKTRIDDVTSALVRQATATRQLDTAGGGGIAGIAGIGGSKGALGRAAIDLSRGIEDFAVAGPLGILNNIPGMVANIGQAAKLSAGQIAALTTGFSLAATAAYILYQNADRVVDLLPQLAKDAFGMSGTKTEAEAMALLEANTHKTAEEQKRLNEYKQESQRIDAMMAHRPKAETAAAAATQEVIAEADPEKVLAGIIKARTKEGRFIEQDEKFGKLREIREKRDKLKEQLDSNQLTQAESMSLGAAGAAPGVREQKLASVQESRRQAIQRLDDEEIALRKEMYDRQKKEAQRTMLDPKALRAEVEKNPRMFPPNLGDELTKIYPPTPKSSAIDQQTDRIRAEGEKRYEQELNAEQKRNVEAYDKAQKIKAALGQDPDANLRGVLAQSKADDEYYAKMQGFGGKLAHLMAEGPMSVGKSMGIEAYGESIRATTGPDPQLKELQEIKDFMREVRDLTRNRPVIAVKKR